MDTKALAAPPVAMLPADQVAAMIEQMKLEQARLLKEQQQVIVQQVMKSLIESGITPTAAPQPAKKGSGRRQQSPSKLEQNLHSLVLHSLEESGLDYPHVQRNTYSANLQHHNQDLRHTRPPAKAIVGTKSKTVVVSRHEGEPSEIEMQDRGATQRAQETGEQCGGEKSAQGGQQPEDGRQNVGRVNRTSPLQLTTRGNARSRKKKSRSHHRSGREQDDEGDDEDFNAVRSKVSHRTLAILDRSRALLDEMKNLHSRQPTRSGLKNEATFVDRMRQKLVEAGTLGVEDASDHGEEATTEEQELSTLHERSAEAEQPTETAVPGVVESQQCTRPPSIGSTRRVEASIKQSQSTSVNCEDIEILRPPVHSPENEHEWENELARQILTIYATSVKAKAAKRPSSRPGTRPTDATNSKAGAPRLGTSCSLPAIGKPSVSSTASSFKQGMPQLNPPPARAVVHYSWEPSQRLNDGKVVVNMPKLPKPIWFAGTGAVKAIWCALAEGFQGLHASPSKAKARTGAMAVCEHQLCEEIRRLEAKQQYSQCITTLETLLISLVRARGVDTLETKLWKQLVVTCNAFASRCVDYKKFPAALKLIKQAEHLLHNSILVGDGMRFELLAYLYDTYAHYYYKRGKSHAGLQYMFKAHEIHTKQSSWAHLAKCRLHIANLLSAQSKHHDAMSYMGSILEMIEDNKLEDPAANNGDTGEGSASAQKICLAAVCYNNLAIEQLHLREFEAASVSTGNAKRLAKLCLSYSNRWLGQFDATGNCVDLAIATLMEDVNAAANAPYKAR